MLYFISFRVVFFFKILPIYAQYKFIIRVFIRCMQNRSKWNDNKIKKVKRHKRKTSRRYIQNQVNYPLKVLLIISYDSDTIRCICFCGRISNHRKYNFNVWTQFRLLFEKWKDGFETERDKHQSWMLLWKMSKHCCECVDLR